MKTIVLLAFLATSLVACKTGPEVNPGRFVDAVVACNSENEHRDTIRANILECVAGIASANYMTCLDLIPYAADEVLCTIRTLLNLRSASINAGSQNAQDTEVVRKLNEYLKANNVSFN